MDLSSALSALGPDGHHIYRDGHPIGKVTQHGHVYDESGNRIGLIEHDGTMLNQAGHELGRIGEDGKIYREGSIHAEAYIEGDHIKDPNGVELGTTQGGSLGAAALVMLV